MGKNFRVFEFIWAYINYLLIITKGDWSDYLEKLEPMLQKIKDNGLKCDIKEVIIQTNRDGIPGFLGDLGWNTSIK